MSVCIQRMSRQKSPRVVEGIGSDLLIDLVYDCSDVTGSICGTTRLLQREIVQRGVGRSAKTLLERGAEWSGIGPIDCMRTGVSDRRPVAAVIVRDFPRETWCRGFDGCLRRGSCCDSS